MGEPLWGTWGSLPLSPNAHFPMCSFASNIHFSQEPIFPKSLFTSVPICPKCPFTPSVRLLRIPLISQISIYLGALVPIISLNPHLSRCPFAPSAQLSRTQMSGIYLSGTQLYGPQLFGTIYPGAHLSVTQMYGPQLSETHLPVAHLSWCSFVLVPICPGPKCPKTACYTPHLHLITSKLLQKCLAIARWRNLNCVDTAFSTSLPDEV